MLEDGGLGHMALIRPIAQWDSIPLRNKGAAILRMVENIVSPGIFKCSIRHYLRKNAYGTVVTDDLWASMQQEITNGLDIKTIMADWVETRGLPVVTVELLHGKMIDATQKPFHNYPPNATDMQMRYIPLTYRTNKGAQQMIWMNKTDVSFSIPELDIDDWIEFNVDRIGYYRVNYGRDLWTRLADQLERNHSVFSELSRSKLFSDAVALANNGEQICFDVFLNLTKYVWKEKSLIPWFNIYEGMRQLFKLFTKTTVGDYKEYLLQQTSHLIDRLHADNGGSYIEKDWRSKVISLSCSAGHFGSIDHSTRAFRAWIENDGAAPDSDVSCPCIAGALQASLWDATFEKYKRTTSRKERDNLLLALSCTEDVALLERLLDYSLDPTIVAAEKTYDIVQSVADNLLAGKVGLIWLKSKYPEIEKAMGTLKASFVLITATRYIRTKEDYEEFLEFYKDHPDISNQAKSEIQEEVYKRINWMERNFQPVSKWLSDFTS